MSGTFMNFMKDNAASIVGAMQLAGTATLLMHFSPVVMACGVLGVLGRSVMLMYGNKKHQQEMAKDPEHSGHDLGDGFWDTLKKATRPSAYPIEFSAALSMVANIAGIGYGASVGLDPELSNDKQISGFVLAGVSAIGSLMYANMLFGKEKKADTGREDDKSLNFASSESKAQGWLGHAGQTLKERPILTSSLIGMALTATIAVSRFAAGDYVFALTGAIMFASNIVQAMFVTKHDFSVDGAKKEAKEQEKMLMQPEEEKKPMSFVEREMIRRQKTNSAELGLT